MFHLICFGPHFIDHVSFLLPSVHSPYHSFHLPQSISFMFTLFGCIHITWSFKLIVSFTFQPKINNLRVCLDKFLILERYSLLEAGLRCFCSSLSLYIKQEIQHTFDLTGRDRSDYQLQSSFRGQSLWFLRGWDARELLSSPGEDKFRYPLAYGWDIPNDWVIAPNPSFRWGLRTHCNGSGFWIPTWKNGWRTFLSILKLRWLLEADLVTLLFLLLIVQRLQHALRQCWRHQRSSEAEDCTWILRSQNKGIFIVSKTQI